jgi:hypothetical protein
VGPARCGHPPAPPNPTSLPPPPAHSKKIGEERREKERAIVVAEEKKRALMFANKHKEEDSSESFLDRQDAMTKRLEEARENVSAQFFYNQETNHMICPKCKGVQGFQDWKNGIRCVGSTCARGARRECDQARRECESH